MTSISVFGKLGVEPKLKEIGFTLGKHFENGFENLGVVTTSLRCFKMVS
jgi:hypothetical protein